MSGHIGTDLDNAAMRNPVSDPGRPILQSGMSDSYNYSSIPVHSQEVASVPATVISPRGSTYSYEEIGNGLTCPTCQGTGKIPRGQADDLVALIPYRDKRLKPQRTWLYVFLSFSLCALIAGVLCAFLIPRTIEVVHDNVTTLMVDLNVSEDRCFLQLQSTYNITNNNFVSVTLNDIQIQVIVMFNKLPIVTTPFLQDRHVGIRTTQQISEPLNMTLTNRFFPIVYCEPSLARDNFVFMKFTSTFNFTLMTQTDQQVVTEYFRINCSPQPTLGGAGSLQLVEVSSFEVPEELDEEYF